MNREQVDIFEKIQGQLESLHTEISILSKKSHNDALNKFKLKFVNQLLISANKILTNEYRPFGDFTIFDEDDIPTTSDVAMILMQYLSCFEKLRSDNVYQSTSTGRWYWIIDGKESYVKTSIPQKITKNK